MCSDGITRKDKRKLIVKARTLFVCTKADSPTNPIDLDIQYKENCKEIYNDNNNVLNFSLKIMFIFIIDKSADYFID